MRGIRRMLLSDLCFQMVRGMFLIFWGDVLKKTEKYSIIFHGIFLNTLAKVLCHSWDIKNSKKKCSKQFQKMLVNSHRNFLQYSQV